MNASYLEPLPSDNNGCLIDSHGRYLKPFSFATDLDIMAGHRLGFSSQHRRRNAHSYAGKQSEIVKLISSQMLLIPSTLLQLYVCLSVTRLRPRKASSRLA